MRRLEAEVVRDAILATSGQLTRKPFGPPVPVMPDEIGQVVIGVDNRDSAGRPVGTIKKLGEDEFRRSVYVQARRSMPLGMLEPFDTPIMFPNCGQRACSTVAPQSLLMMNNEFVAECASTFAQRLQRNATEDSHEPLVKEAWLLAFGREPSEAEMKQSVGFLAGSKLDERLVYFCHALLCSNPFLYVE